MDLVVVPHLFVEKEILELLQQNRSSVIFCVLLL